MGTEPNEAPCLICGGTRYVWGQLQGQVSFSPDQEGSFWRFFKTPQAFRARHCLKCGNLQLFAAIEQPVGEPAPTTST